MALKEQFNEILKETKIIAILRGITPSEAAGVAEALIAGDIRLIEVPLNSPDVYTSISIISEVCKKHGNALAGAGTVTEPEHVRAVHKAGGAFIISPETNAEVIKETVTLGMLSIPGFMTPTEAFNAIRAGADILKLFPSVSLGTAYIKQIKAVIKHPILSVGGVSEDNMKDYLAVCDGVGIGASLYKPGMPLDEVKTKISNFKKSL